MWCISGSDPRRQAVMISCSAHDTRVFTVLPPDLGLLLNTPGCQCCSVPVKAAKPLAASCTDLATAGCPLASRALPPAVCIFCEAAKAAQRVGRTSAAVELS